MHFVDGEVDHGPIIAQRAVPVRSGLTEETLHACLQEEKQRLFPEVVKAFVAGCLRVEGLRMIWEET